MPKRPKNDLEKFSTKKGVSRADITVGSLESQTFTLSATDDAFVWKVCDINSGKVLKGQDKPYALIREEESANSAKVALAAPARFDIAVLYRVHTEEDEDKPEDQPELM